MRTSASEDRSTVLLHYPFRVVSSRPVHKVLMIDNNISKALCLLLQTAPSLMEAVKKGVIIIASILLIFVAVRNSLVW